MDLISSQIGPFVNNIPCQVPLWMAMYFKQLQKCTIIPPQWLSVDSLTKFKELEENDTNCADPPHLQYMEISQILTRNASSDIDK